MRDEFDKLFDAAFDEAAGSHTFTPDFEPSWQKVEKKLRRRRKARSRMKLVVLAAISFVLGALIFGAPSASQAFKPFFQSARAIPDGMVRLVFGENRTDNVKPKTEAPPDHVESDKPKGTVQDGSAVESGKSRRMQFDSLEAASGALSFSLPDIGYIPEGYQITGIVAIAKPGQSKASTLIVTYEKDAKMSFQLTIQQVQQEKFGTNFDPSQGDFETVQIDGHKAYVFVSEDAASLEIVKGNLYEAIQGEVSKEEMMRIAEALR